MSFCVFVIFCLLFLLHEQITHFLNHSHACCELHKSIGNLHSQKDIRNHRIVADPNLRIPVMGCHPDMVVIQSPANIAVLNLQWEGPDTNR